MRLRGVEITNVLKLKLEELLFFISKIMVHNIITYTLA